MTNTVDLTRNQTLVLSKLSNSEQPKTAYTLLDELREDGIKAPLQVYRALDKLVAQGRVHRLESISAFVACQHPDCESHAATVFMLCEKCRKVTEFSDKHVASAVAGVAQGQSFRMEKTSIEIRGECAKCLSKAKRLKAIRARG
jgi:Fur family transcriptional regulator, zinc uptake regulator